MIKSLQYLRDCHAPENKWLAVAEYSNIQAQRKENFKHLYHDLKASRNIKEKGVGENV